MPSQLRILQTDKQHYADPLYFSLVLYKTGTDSARRSNNTTSAAAVKRYFKPAGSCERKLIFVKRGVIASLTNIVDNIRRMEVCPILDPFDKNRVTARICDQRNWVHGPFCGAAIQWIEVSKRVNCVAVGALAECRLCPQ